MSKKKKKTEPQELKPFEITSAGIKDGLCNYSYKINTGVGIGDVHNVKGVGVVDDDMFDAFRNLNVHLAAIDDIFKHAGEDIESIDKMHNNALTALYIVSGFKIKGSGENEQVTLIGDKHINSGGRIALVTPAVPLDNLSSYTWAQELKEAIEQARIEVELYKGGKCTATEAVDIDNQMTINDQIDFDKGAL